MASYTDLPEDGRGRRGLTVAVVFLVLAAVVLYLPADVQGQLAAGIRATLLRPFVITQEALANARVRGERVSLLQGQLDSLAAVVASQASLKEENQQLRAHLALAPRTSTDFVHANAIRPGTPGSESVFLLDVGSDMGVQVGDPVLMRTGRVGLVGVIREVRGRSALGIDWSHPDFRASGMTADGEVSGLVQASERAFAEAARLRLNGTPFYETLEQGTLITTSGLGGVFPRGIPIGEVEMPVEAVAGWRKDYLLRPAVEASRVLHVLVVLADSLTEDMMAQFRGDPPPGEGGGRMKSQAVLRIMVPALVLLHFFLHLGLGLGRVVPDLLTLALLLAAREVGMGWGAGLGFFFGTLEDAFSVLAFGASTLALTVVGILGARTRDLFVGDSFLFLFIYLFAGKILRDLIHWVAVGEGLREPFVNSILVTGSLAALYGAAVGVILTVPFGGSRNLR